MPFFCDHGLVSSIIPEPCAEPAVRVFIWDNAGRPQAVRLEVHNDVEFTRAMEVIRLSRESFVLYNGWRYRSTGEGEPYHPEYPASAAELALLFDVEYEGTDLEGRQLVYIFTQTWEEFENAARAVSYLMQRGELSGQSYIEYNRPHDWVYGISAARLVTDAPLDALGVVLIERENAYRRKNGLPVEPVDGWPAEIWPASYWA